MKKVTNTPRLGSWHTFYSLQLDARPCSSENNEQPSDPGQLLNGLNSFFITSVVTESFVDCQSDGILEWERGDIKGEMNED